SSTTRTFISLRSSSARWPAILRARGFEFARVAALAPSEELLSHEEDRFGEPKLFSHLRNEIGWGNQSNASSLMNEIGWENQSNSSSLKIVSRRSERSDAGELEFLTGSREERTAVTCGPNRQN